MIKQIQQEPVLFQGVVQAVLALVIAFGVSLSPAQMGSILALTAAILTFWTRTQVTPVVNPRAADGTPLVAPAPAPAAASPSA